MTIEHKHMLVRARIEFPPVDPDIAKLALIDLVSQIGMKLLGGYGQNNWQNPQAVYCSDPANRGLTAFALIETSHISMHVWDQESPALLELDVYTCAALDEGKVLSWMEQFGLLEHTFWVLDRKEELRLLSSEYRFMPCTPLSLNSSA